MERKERKESLPVKIARRTVETYVKEGRLIEPPEDLPDFLKERAGTFVSIKKKDKSLRGCIGTILATQANLAEEIIRNAIAAATEDPRFPPISEKELDDLVYSVDVLSKAEKVPDESHLDPAKYGLIVQSGYCRGLLLPDIDGVDTVEDQICIAKRKVGLPDDEPCELFRFTVTRYEED